MKKIYHYVLVLFAVLCMASCGADPQSALGRIETFISEVEECADTYSEEKWASVEQRFEAMCAQIEENRWQLTPEQESQYNKLRGRYQGARTKHSIMEAADELERKIKALPDILEGFVEGLEDGE